MKRLFSYGFRNKNLQALSGINLSPCVFMLLFILCFAGISPPALTAKDKDQDQGAVIVSPRDFIEKNLNIFKERLRLLKEGYEKQYGSFFAATSPTDIEAIAKELPRPTTIRLAIQYPRIMPEEEKKIVPEKGEYFVGDMYKSISADPLFNLTSGHFFQRDEMNNPVSADPITTQLLGLPQKMNLSVNGGIRWVSSERLGTAGVYGETCCTAVGKQQYCIKASSSPPYKCIQTGTYDYCSQHAQLPAFGFAWGDPRYYVSQLNLRVEKGPGINIDAKLREVTFTSPGKKDITIVSSKKYSPEEEYRVYRSCVPQFSSTYVPGNNKAIIGYRSAGNTSVGFYFTAVAFRKFGFPGFEIDSTHGKMSDLDHFYDQKTVSYPYSYWGNSAGELSPLVLLDYGNAGGEKAISASYIGAPVTWSTVSPGPFTINDGVVSYKGGIGATKFRVTLGGYESVERSVTANVIEVVLDAAMSRGEVSPGKIHKVLVRVKGPADLSLYQVKWTGSGGSWAQPMTPFRKSGEEWHAEGAFSVPFEGPFDSAKLKKPVIIAADVIRTTDSKEVYSYENSGLATSYPAMDKLELFAGIDKNEPERVTEPIDLFVSSETSGVLLSPRVILRDGKSYATNEINPGANIEVNSSNPSAVYIRSEQAQLRSGKVLPIFNLMAYPGERPGTSKVTARLGGHDIDALEQAQFTGDQRELKSDPLEFTVNNVFLIAESNQNGRTTYKLMVMGPADMAKYRAHWSGEAIRTTSFNKDAGGFVSTLETTLRMIKVEIKKAGYVAARLNVKTTARNVNIKLLPSKPPVTVVKQVAVSDMGSLETISECKKSVSFQMEYMGFNPGMAPEEYCRAERQKDKQDILSQREDQKAFNKMVRDLKKQGQELVIMSDTMRIGAAIKGDFAGLGDTPFCYWTVQNAGALALENRITPVEILSSNEGGCFNIVKGLKDGFNPEATVKVDLIMLSKPEAPVVTSGERIVTNGTFLGR